MMLTRRANATPTSATCVPTHGSMSTATSCGVADASERARERSRDAARSRAELGERERPERAAAVAAARCRVIVAPRKRGALGVLVDRNDERCASRHVEKHIVRRRRRAAEVRRERGDGRVALEVGHAHVVAEAAERVAQPHDAHRVAAEIGEEVVVGADRAGVGRRAERGGERVAQQPLELVNHAPAPPEGLPGNSSEVYQFLPR